MWRGWKRRRWGKGKEEERVARRRKVRMKRGKGGSGRRGEAK